MFVLSHYIEKKVDLCVLICIYMYDRNTSIWRKFWEKQNIPFQLVQKRNKCNKKNNWTCYIYTRMESKLSAFNKSPFIYMSFMLWTRYIVGLIMIIKTVFIQILNWTHLHFLVLSLLIANCVEQVFFKLKFANNFSTFQIVKLQSLF